MVAGLRIILAIVLYIVVTQVSLEIIQAIIGNTDRVLIAIGVFVILMAIGSGFFTRYILKRRRLEQQLKLETKLLNTATNSIIVNDLNG